METTRPAAAAAGLVVTAGAVTMLVALVAAPGPWTRGYVSEAGAAGQPAADAYVSGVILLAAGVALLAVAVRRCRPAALLLAGAAALAGMSGAVRCSERCPLPPYEPTTPADVVHAGAGILGMLLLAGAMVAVACSELPPLVRRMAGVAAALTVPLGAAQGLTMLLAGRVPLVAALERTLLAVAVGWLIGTSAAVAAAQWTSVRGTGKI